MSAEFQPKINDEQLRKLVEQPTGTLHYKPELQVARWVNKHIVVYGLDVKAIVNEDGSTRIILGDKSEGAELVLMKTGQVLYTNREAQRAIQKLDDVDDLEEVTTSDATSVLDGDGGRQDHLARKPFVADTTD